MADKLTMEDLLYAKRKMQEERHNGKEVLHLLIPGWAVPVMREKGFEVDYLETDFGLVPHTVMTENEYAELMSGQGRWKDG